MPLNFEMAATDEMVAIALRHRRTPPASCPRSARSAPPRAASTSSAGATTSARASARWREAGIRVSLFVEPDRRRSRRRRALGAPVVELHTGSYCEAALEGDARAARRTSSPGSAARAEHGARLGLEIHAGHGLDLDSVGPVAAIPQIRELNIGHSLIGEAIFVGLEPGDARHAGRDGRGARGPGRMIIGIGSDLCDIRRIERPLERFGERFTHRVFTEGSGRAAIGGRPAPRPTRGASPPRRPAPRRSAPASRAACSGATWRW